MVVGRNYFDFFGSFEEISLLMFVNYKTSDGVSYEDLFDFVSISGEIFLEFLRGLE